MAINSLPLFPVPIGLVNFGKKNHQLNIELVEDALKEKTNNSGEDHSNMGGWHSTTNLETKYNSYKNLCNIITECGNEYCRMHGYKDGIICTDLWANINQSGDLNFMHHHGSTALAGVYYPIESLVENDWRFNYTNENPLKGGSWNNVDGGSLVLEDPSYGKKTQLLTDKPSAFNMDCYHMYPTASVLILFPSYLLHMVLPFRENKTRVSISFAFKYG
jgi:hypothetical protein